MCGIAGIVSPSVDPGVSRRMLAVQRYRGPDGDGSWSHRFSTSREVWFGHRRLSIIDLSDAGAQPMSDAAGDFTITYNGEIYNYVEVRAELATLGVQFRSGSDTEVLLEAYKQWGDDCVSRLNGMFAFAIFDRPRGRIFCARDRYGEKPFLYSLKPDLFAFASEYKALLQHPAISCAHDEWRLVRAAHNPSTGLDGDRQTVFHDIQQLLPGEAMEVRVDTLRHRVWRYWKVQPGPLRESAPEADVFAEFRELLTDAVRLRLRSDVRVGSCLSGGLDSSAITCIVRKLLGADAPYHTFTGTFPGTTADETDYAREVIRATGVASHMVEPTAERFVAELPQFMWHNELPVGSSSQFAQWCVFELAKQEGVTVLMDGQGADEVLGGYEQYFAPYLEALAERGDRERLAREAPAIRARYPLALASRGRSLRDKAPLFLRHWASNAFGVGSSPLFGVPLASSRKLIETSALPKQPGLDPLANALEADSFGRYLTVLLRYGDRNSMAHSREVRLPFCDHRIAEFVFSLPPHLLMGEVQTKRLLRESMRGILPERVRTRWNKQGFRPPQDRWFTSPQLLALVRRTLSSSSFQHSPYWIPSWWDKAISRIEAGQTGLAWAVWGPFIIEQWREHFLQPLMRSRAQAEA